MTELVGTTDGTATSYPKTLSNEPVVADSVSVTDGAYTLASLPGSSGDGNFSAFYNSSAKQVTVFYSSAPAAGSEIKTTYSYVTNGISGALSGDGEQWMAISVDGTEQGARQRVLAVPFAQSSDRANRLNLQKNIAVPFANDFQPSLPVTIPTNRRTSIVLNISKNN